MAFAGNDKRLLIPDTMTDQSPRKHNVVLLGAGGHAKGVIEALVAQDTFTIYGLTSHPEYTGPADVLGYPVLGDDSIVPQLRSSGLSHYIIGLGSVRANSKREQLFKFGTSCHLTPVCAIHPAALVSDTASVQSGSVIFSGAIVGADSYIGHNVIINHGAIVEHDCVIGDHAHVATGACLAGGVTVEPSAHIGAGATLLQNICIGANAVVAAGAVVTRNVKADTTVRGVPAC